MFCNIKIKHYWLIGFFSISATNYDIMLTHSMSYIIFYSHTQSSVPCRPFLHGAKACR